MNINEVLELDFVIEQVSDNTIDITGEPTTGSSTINYIDKRAGIFNPSETGIHQLDINGQTVEIDVVDIPDGEVNRYDFESASVPAIDRGGSSDMSINGASFVTNPVKEGSYALDFDGADDDADTGIDQNTSNSFTVTLWVRPDGLTNQPTITGVWGGGSAAEWQIATDHFEAYDGSNNYKITHSTTTGNWQFKAITWDGSTLTGYSGDPTASVSSDGGVSASMQDTTNKILLGSDYANSAFFNGAVDMWRRFDRSLSQSEIESIRQADA